jgi:hypothetical protein
MDNPNLPKLVAIPPHMRKRFGSGLCWFNGRQRDLKQKATGYFPVRANVLPALSSRTVGY